MGIDTREGCRIVDESDDSIIDDDEVLLEKGSVLILLKPTDTWIPAASSLTSLNTSQDVVSGSNCETTGPSESACVKL